MTSPPLTQDLSATIVQLEKSPRNLTRQLLIEVMHKDGNLRIEQADTMARLAGTEGARRVCGGPVISFCQQFAERHGHKPRVLDFGAGPVTSLAYLIHEDLADVTALDALGDEYRELYAKHGIDNPFLPIHGTGEALFETVEPESFDLVHVRNALDHTQAPALTWLNLFKATRIGGVLAHSHSLNEATAQQHRQLHQYDLYPEQQQLLMRDTTGHIIEMTRHLPLRLAWHAVDSKDGGQTGWFIGGYERLEGDPGPTFVHQALDQLTRTFIERSAWAFQLEALIAKLAPTIDPDIQLVDVPINPNRA